MSIERQYHLATLDETTVNPNPFKQFSQWYEEAIHAQILDPHAMTLATVNPKGEPSVRIVLLKRADERGFTFFTNYDSQKGQELAINPQAALLFYWAALERQIRIEGFVEKTSETESDDYFASRPLNSQLGAWASAQSMIIPHRQLLETKMAELQTYYANQPIPRPPYWGGYRLIPQRIELWQGRENRLHDRINYLRHANNTWEIQRLSP